MRHALPQRAGSSGSGSPTAAARRWRSSRTATSSARSSRRRWCTSRSCSSSTSRSRGSTRSRCDTLADVLRGEAARGAAVLFSSHQLELVEDICEEVAIIDHGRVVATGDVDALKRASQRRRIELQLDGAPPEWLPDVAGVELVERRNGDLRLVAGRDVDPELVLAAAERSAQVVAFSYGPPTLAELFLELVAA